MTKPWLRLYRDAIHRPKVGRMALDQVGFWSACLMMSNDDGSLPQIEDIAWTLRLTDLVVGEYLSVLERNGLVTRYVTGNVTAWGLHDWDVHQRKSDHDDSGAERQRKWREAQKAQKSASPVTETERNALRNGPVTLPDTDTDTDKRREVVERVTAPLPKRGTRWPSEAVVSEEWITEGEGYRELAGHPHIDLRAEALKFANYWASKSGGAATKIDWKRTWLNWCLQAKGHTNGSGFGRKSQLEQLADIVAEARTIDYDN